MENNFTKKIIDKIKNREIKMRPRVYFILKTGLLVLTGIVILFSAFFLVSFIIFNLRLSGVWFAPKFGLFGLREFFASLPWIMIIFTLILVALVEIFAKKFASLWRQPIIFSTLIIIIFIVIVGFLVDKAEFHRGIFLRLEKRPVPILRDFYRNDFIKPRNIYQGAVGETSKDGFLLITPEGKKFNVLFPTSSRQVLPEIKEGESIMIMGKRIGDKIFLRGVHDMPMSGMFWRRPALPMK